MDAGVLASALTLEEQSQIETVLVTHSHLDHVSDLGAMCDARALQDGGPLVVAAGKETVEALKTHFFNDVLWPDFSRIPGKDGPTLVYRELEPEVPAPPTWEAYIEGRDPGLEAILALPRGG